MANPTFYDENRVGELYLTRNTDIAAQGVAGHRLTVKRSSVYGYQWQQKYSGSC